ncbi:ComEC/Rec2 family competence protein [Salinibaculum salinum]|uniref:ComEC/Rec2 family competence protein n=1 Tax=Salinibaculum salinum TaxID=3131996 RepID=UPI0030ED4DD4
MSRAVFVLVLVGLVTLAGCAGDPVDEGPTPATTEDGNDTPPSGTLEIHHIDVGQADATLVITPAGETILIDTGDWRQDGQGVIEYLEAHGVDRVDHLVATHAHADHIGGHAAVIEHFETEGDGVGAAYDSGVASTSQTYGNYLDAIEEHEVTLFEVEEGDTLPFGDDNVSATVLNPPAGDAGSDIHDNSVALTLEFGDVRYLTTGDAESAVERRLVADWRDELDADIYQAGHHGSSTSSSETFLDAVSPEVAVISSGFDSQYGHPSDETLRRFADHEIGTYWTGVHDDIVVTTDGTNVTVETESDASTDPLDLLGMKPTDESANLDRIPPGLLSPTQLHG